jgi:uncharacterized protein YdaU (DUF1376 family)
MAGQLWYRHYALDFLNGVVGMPPDQIGAYIVVLDLIYARGGRIPNDPRWIGGNMGCSTKSAIALISALLKRGKLHEVDGYLVNDKAEQVLKNEDEKSAKNILNGSIGGRQRADNARRAKENNELDQAGLKPNRVEKNRIEEGRDMRAGADAREAPEQPSGSLSAEIPSDLADVQSLAQECARAAGTRQVEPAQFGRDIALCREWLALGAPPDLILQTIREGVAAAAGGKAIFSLRYFDQSIRTATARQEATRNVRTRTEPDTLAALALRIAAGDD